MKTAATTHTQDKPEFFVGQFVLVTKGGGRAKTYEFVGIITEMYPRFAIVQMPGGYRETFYYEEMQTKNVKPF